ncbi:MAG: XrtN system VIT domain-containing protein [Flavobacterium sp.]
MKTSGNIIRNYLKKDGVTLSIIAALVSTSFLILSIVSANNDLSNLDGICFFGSLIEFAYSIIVVTYLSKNKQKYLHLIPLLYLNWFIGCFCTNVFINIFENLPLWVYIVTFAFCISCFPIYGRSRNSKLRTFAYLINGITITLIFYYAVYLIPFSVFSFLGIFALGMGFYGLVPVIVLINHSIALSHLAKENKKGILAFTAGICFILASLTVFTVLLDSEADSIRKNLVTKSFEKTSNDLPNYILISQNLKPSFLNEVLLKKDIVYIDTEDFFDLRDFNSIGQKQYNERKVHNPFYNVAYQLIDKIGISTDDQISIMKSNFGKRLETEEQLWNGEDLITKNIKEDVKLFPKERLAYTEITMDVACKERAWRASQEAIYSFELPEGSVATSLSLWVNGVERKGVLTTKEKAQKAYNQIVGVEMRDPSLMQWREGNRVVVRVFPVSQNLPRTFKCGFTTPLKADAKKLTYNSIQIKGPNLSGAATLSRIQVNGHSNFESTKDFELTDQFYISESTGLDDWQATVPINKGTFANAFAWKGKEYKIEPIERQREVFVPKEIVLDLSSSWSLEEIRELVSMPSKKFYVVDEYSKEEINSSNYENIFHEYRNLQYSLPPLYKISDSSLIITKCGTFSANFDELEATAYLKKIRENTKAKHLRAINIGNEINPFWQTVKEQHYVEYSKLTLAECQKAIKENSFISVKTADNRVNIEIAGISINEIPATADVQNTGINHIYRMYAFGKVLAEHVASEDNENVNNKYVYLAKDANIVTPVSSLIVLETDEDYEKNGIEKNADGLGNASINNDGSVPEPHEWLMIIIGLGILAYYYKKQRNQLA